MTVLEQPLRRYPLPSLRRTRRGLRVMGVLNVTPDSFSDGGRFLDPGAAVARGVQMADEGAAVLDVGGESTRPGAGSVPAAEELRRTIPVIERLAKAVRVPIAIDTAKAEVAARALDAGASMVNDVTALHGDSRMAAVVARAKTSVVLMHMQGTPRTMQQHPRYRDVVAEVCAFLQDAAARAQAQGIEARRILIDPGLGFGKTVRHNLELMRSLDRFAALGFPVVVGPSRKSFIGKTLGVEVEDRLAGTLACVAVAHRCGAHLVRVHDVKPAVQLIRMLEAIESAAGFAGDAGPGPLPARSRRRAIGCAAARTGGVAPRQDPRS